MSEDKLKRLYVDIPAWQEEIKVDDFLVTIGVKQSNSVYHVAEVKVTKKEPRLKRNHVKVYVSDLQTALNRNKETQALHTLTWYKREKKKV